MNTYRFLGVVRGLPTQIPTQNNRYAKLACTRSCCSNKKGNLDGLYALREGFVLYVLGPGVGTS
jgi:hypothetical protein